MENLSQFKQILERLLAFPLKEQIRVGFDVKKKVFSLSVPIFTARSSLCPSVKEYIEKREGRTFKPHMTFFILEKEKRVRLTQEIPFLGSFYPPSLREHLVHFCQLAKKCHRLLMELAEEDALTGISLK